MKRMITVLFTIACLAVTAVPAFAQDAPWPTHAIYNGARGQDGLEFGDPNADGHPDLVSAFEIDRTIKVIINPGRGRSWHAETIASTPDPEDAIFADLDADGNLDIVVSQGIGNEKEGNEPGVKVLWAPPFTDYYRPSAWSEGLITATAGKGHFLYCKAVQLDGKHGPDIIATGRARSELLWLEAAANPRQMDGWKRHVIDRVGGAWVFRLLDIDQDGDQDVILADVETKSTTKGVRWLENPGPGSALNEKWPSHRIGGNESEMQNGASVAIGDVDRDGLKDVILQCNKVMLYFRCTGTKPVAWKTYRIPLPAQLGKYAKDVAVADLNGDGRMDLIANRGDDGWRDGGISAKEWAVYWMEYSGAKPGTEWKCHVIRHGLGLRREKWERILPYDFDGDGDLDIVSNEKKAWTALPPEAGGSVLGIIWMENKLKQE